MTVHECDVAQTGVPRGEPSAVAAGLAEVGVLLHGIHLWVIGQKIFQKEHRRGRLLDGFNFDCQVAALLQL